MSLLTKWRPIKHNFPLIEEDFFDLDLHPLQSLNRFFKEGMFSELGTTDVYEKDGQVITETNLAGFNPENVDIEIEDDSIKITASFEDTKEEKNDKEGRKYYKKEMVQKNFSRLIPLPNAIKDKEAKAEYKDGILKITAPKDSQKEKVKLKITK